MNAFATAGLVFASLSCAGLLGLGLRALLPDHHLSKETHDSVKIAMATVASMAALVLALLVSSTKGSYDTEKGEMTQMAAKVIFLDRVLADYGSQTAEARNLLRESVEQAIIRMWPDENSEPSELAPTMSWSEGLPRAIHALSPADDTQTSLKAQAITLANELVQIRWLLFEQAESTISMPMLTVVVAWLAIIFLSIGLFAPPNGTIVIAILLAALSVSGAVFLILELDLAFDGLIRFSSEPMRNALNQLRR